MKLSLSVRIAEGFLSKEHALMDLATLTRLARAAGYEGICMRGSQVGVHSSPETVREAAQVLRDAGVAVTMVTGDFDIVYNNDRGPSCLRNIVPHLELARTLGAPLVRVALKRDEDIQHTWKAADMAREYGITLVHQCHILSLFETVDGIESTLRKIGRPNFGLIYEAANLELCGQEHGRRTLRRLAPWIFNVYVQNQRLHPNGKVTLETWARGPVSFDILPVPAPGGIDFAEIIRGLVAIGYNGPLTVHQSAPADGSPVESATAAARYLRGLLSRTG